MPYRISNSSARFNANGPICMQKNLNIKSETSKTVIQLEHEIHESLRRH